MQNAECRMGIRVITIKLGVPSAVDRVDVVDMVDEVDARGRPATPGRPPATDSLFLFPSSLWQISI